MVAVALSEQLALFRRLLLQRAQQSRLGGRCAVGVAGAEFLELRRVAREGGVVERQRKPRALPDLLESLKGDSGAR